MYLYIYITPTRMTCIPYWNAQWAQNMHDSSEREIKVRAPRGSSLNYTIGLTRLLL